MMSLKSDLQEDAMKIKPLLSPLSLAAFSALLAFSVLTSRATSSHGLTEEPVKPRPDAVLAGLQAFFARTALPDGSFRPGIDPAYDGLSDSAYSDLAPVTYVVVLHKTFGWKLPNPEKTQEFLLSRQKQDGAFLNVKGTADPKAAQARLYNTTQGLVALHALGLKPRYDPLPVFEAILEKGDYKIGEDAGRDLAFSEIPRSSSASTGLSRRRLRRGNHHT
jgi:hypothetical protein